MSSARLNDARPPTPPNHPKYGVHLSNHDIRLICELVFPERKLDSIESLTSGSSYNNRIYFLRLDSIPPSSSDHAQEEHVLKVNGRFFGFDKIQNEVACLFVLEKHCPNAPVPRVIAWSEEATQISHVSTDRSAIITTSLPPNSKTGSKSGWLLVSRLPGDPISQHDLDEHTLKQLSVQLADIVAEWRTSVPHQSHCGSLRFSPESCQTQAGADIILKEQHDARYPSLVVKGLLPVGLVPAKPICRTLEYYTTKLEGQIRKLETEMLYRPNRHLVSTLQSFVSEKLPLLKLFEQSEAHTKSFLFTHYDLSPRNVLVAGDPLRIVGVVDFEFAGFYPWLDEFINDAVGNEGDWIPAAYSSYCERLEQVGLRTPRSLTDPTIWQQAMELGNLEQNIAPWWLQEGITPASQVTKDLEIAAAMVQKSMLELA